MLGGASKCWGGGAKHVGGGGARMKLGGGGVHTPPENPPVAEIPPELNYKTVLCDLIQYYHLLYSWFRLPSV